MDAVAVAALSTENTLMPHQSRQVSMSEHGRSMLESYPCSTVLTTDLMHLQTNNNNSLNLSNIGCNQHFVAVVDCWVHTTEHTVHGGRALTK